MRISPEPLRPIAFIFGALLDTSIAKIFGVMNSSLNSFFLRKNYHRRFRWRKVLGKLWPEAKLHKQETAARDEELIYLSSGRVGFW